MLQTSRTNNPPPILASGNVRKRPTKSALSVIRADIQPIGKDPDLLQELRRLSKQNNIKALVALYEAYTAMAGGLLLLQNQPRADDVDDFLEEERCQAWAKAYLVADFLKDMRPDNHQVESYSRVLFDCALQMGCNFPEAAAIVQEISAWFPEEGPH